MPLSRYQVRNEYSLADPELYREADKDDPEALLEGVAMAGLVGVLRQLGDLAEFAAEIFHDLHEEVMVTAARGHALMVRVQQLELEFPPIEKAFLSQTSHSTFYFNSGTEWHPNLQMNQNLITKGDLPRFVMDSYEEARGPPRLFLLDKFDIAGAGSCLKRYTDPSFYKVEASFIDMESVDVQRDKKFRKAKKKGPRWKNGETPEILPSSKLHQLFLEEQVESGASDPARLVKLRRKSSASAFSSENGKSYMGRFLKTPPEDKVVHEVFLGSSPLELLSKSTTRPGLESQRLDVSYVGHDEEPVHRIRGPFPPPSMGQTIIRPCENDFFEDKVEEKTSVGATSNPSFDDKEINVDERESYHSDSDDVSEIDNYMDALATIESEVEADTEIRSNKEGVDFLNIEKHETDSNPNDEQLQSQRHSQFSDSQLIGNLTASDDGKNSIRNGLSSFSFSDDTVSTSAEDTPSTEIGETEVTFISSSQDSANENVMVGNIPEHEASENACTELAEIHVNKTPLSSTIDPEAIFVEDDKSGELESDDSSSEGEILSDPVKTEEQLMNDESNISSGPAKNEERLADEGGEISSGLSEIEEWSTDENGKSSGGPMKMEEQLTNEEHLEDESKLEDSYVDSSTLIDAANIVEEIHEKEGSESSLEDVVQTKVEEEVLSPDSVISHPEEQPSVLHLERLAENKNDDLSGKSESPNIDLVYSDERYFDGTQNEKPSQDSESDVEEGGNEPRVNLVAVDFLAEFSGSQYPSFLADNHSQSDEREDNMVHTEAEVEKTLNSSLLENHAQSDEREGNGRILESELLRGCSHVEETDVSLSSDCIPVLASLEEMVDPETDKLDLQPLNIPESSELSSQLEPVDSPNHMNHKTHSNADFDTFALTAPIQPLDSPTQPLDEADMSLLTDCIPVLEERFDPETDTLDLQSVDIPEGSEFSSQLEPIDPPTQPLVQEKALQVKELDAGPAQLNLVESNEIDHESWPGPISGEASVSEFPQTSNHTFEPLTPSSVFPGFKLLPEVAQLNLEEMPPLPPLPPMQWRIGKFPHASVPSGRDDGQQKSHFPSSFPSMNSENMQSLNTFLPLPPTNIANSHHEDLTGNMVNSTPFLLPMSTQNLGESRVDFLALGQTQSSNPLAEHAGEGEMIQPTVNHSDHGVDFLALGQTRSNPFIALPETFNETPAITPGLTSACSSETPNGESTQSPHQLSSEVSLGKEEQDQSFVVSEMMIVGPPEDFVPHPPVENRQPEHVEQTTEEEIICSSSSSIVSDMINVGPTKDFVPHPPVENRQPEHVEQTTEEDICSSSTSAVPSVDDERLNALPSINHEWPNGNQIPKLPRPWSPLIDAVIAHDKSKLRKVTERVRQQEDRVEEKDSVLEQIRTKSFNLKPAVATRPIIQGPRTNLRVAAILEKANAIRQAFAGSDDDEDSWSDS